MCLLNFCATCCKAWTRSIHAWAYAHKHMLCSSVTTDCEQIDQLYGKELDSFKKSSGDADVDITNILDEIIAKYPVGKNWRHGNCWNFMNLSAVQARESPTAVGRIVSRFELILKELRSTTEATHDADAEKTPDTRLQNLWQQTRTRVPEGTQRHMRETYMHWRAKAQYACLQGKVRGGRNPVSTRFQTPGSGIHRRVLPRPWGLGFETPGSALQVASKQRSIGWSVGP